VKTGQTLAALPPSHQKKEKTKWPKMPEANLSGFKSLIL
jgi:hypothetical protein